MRGKIPNGYKVISYQWVLKKKLKRSGLIDYKKAQLVAQGYKQIASIDYFETFALVLRYATL
jgi:hypothetical protein